MMEVSGLLGVEVSFEGLGCRGLGFRVSGFRGVHGTVKHQGPATLGLLDLRRC